MKNKCFLISSTLMILMFVFTLRTLSEAYVERETELITHYEGVIEKILTDEDFKRGYVDGLKEKKEKNLKMKVPENPLNK